MKKIAIVIPARNEAQHIENHLETILRQVDGFGVADFSILLIDDGSSDHTAEAVKKTIGKFPDKIGLVCLSRHFGKEAAILAGLKHASSFDAVIVMDSDLQHPPELISQFVEQWQAGNLIVEGVKQSRGDEALAKNVLTRAYFRLFNFFTEFNIGGMTDFKLLDASVVAVYCGMTEHNRFFRGLVKWMNFPTHQIPFDVPATARAGSTWGSFNLFRYAVSSITSFTAFPLQIVTLLGAITFVMSAIIGGIALFDKLTGKAVDGFTTVILLILLVGSVLMFSIGLIGTYVGKIYDEVKRRPNYIVDTGKSDLELFR